nr:baseplate J/gp47 family protein [Pseudoflavonifractor sp. 524-17]
MAEAIVLERVLTNYAANQNIPSRAVGDNLDALAELFYTQARPQAKAATCTVRFNISEAQGFNLLIPKGIRVTDTGKTLVWETLEDVYISIGETYADSKVRCQTAGKQGNGYVKGQIDSIIDPFAYFLSCENLTESDGGADAATDEEFYELLRLSMDGYSCAGARGGYIYFAKQVSTEIADVIAASPTPGVVKLYVLMNDGTPATPEMKEQVLAACSADDVRPLTDLVSLEDPENVDYHVRLTYYMGQDNPISAQALDAAVKEKVREYTAWQSAKLGRDINPSRLISMLMETGIKRVDLFEPAFTDLKDGSGTEAPQLARLAGDPEIINGGYEDE